MGPAPAGSVPLALPLGVESDFSRARAHMCSSYAPSPTAAGKAGSTHLSGEAAARPRFQLQRPQILLKVSIPQENGPQRVQCPSEEKEGREEVLVHQHPTTVPSSPGCRSPLSPKHPEKSRPPSPWEISPHFPSQGVWSMSPGSTLLPST